MWLYFVVLTLGLAAISFLIWCMRSLAAELRRPKLRDVVVRVAR